MNLYKLTLLDPDSRSLGLNISPWLSWPARWHSPRPAFISLYGYTLSLSTKFIDHKKKCTNITLQLHHFDCVAGVWLRVSKSFDIFKWEMLGAQFIWKIVVAVLFKSSSVLFLCYFFTIIFLFSFSNSFSIILLCLNCARIFNKKRQFSCFYLVRVVTFKF